jgi:ATP-binding cassette, subfamily B, bacterial
MRFFRQLPLLNRLGLAGRQRRIPEVRQMAATECGVAALAMVLGYHGRHVSLDQIRNSLAPGRGGSSARSIIQVGELHGLTGRTVTTEMDGLASLPVGAILHWEFRHFVVFERLNRNTVDLVDPATGYRSVPLAAFRRAFTGVAIVFEPNAMFERAAAKSKGTWRFLKHVLEHKGTVAQLISLSVIVQVCSAALPLLTGVLIDRVVPRRDYSLLLVLTVGFCGLQVFNAIAGLLREYLTIHFRIALEATLTLRFLDHLVALPYSFFQRRTSGDLMMRLGSNTAVRDILTSTLLSTFLDGVMASIYLALLIVVSVPLTLTVMVLVTIRMSLLAVMRWRQRKLLRESLENQARSQTSQVEMLNGMETLKAMGLERWAADNWSNVFVDGLNLSMRRDRLEATFNFLMNLLGTASNIALLFYGTYVVLNGGWTLGSMMAFSALAAGFLGPVSKLVSSGLQLQMLETYVERLNDVLDTPREQDVTTVSAASPLTGALQLSGVSFRYGGSQAPWTLEDVSVIIRPGLCVALVGRTGSGKTTLARLLAGLYEPEAGRILLDGKDLKSFNLRSVRRQLGIVTQEAQLFGGSIRTNISLADPNMSMHRIIQAARLACIDEEINVMPLGYETPLTDRGLSLSGGQRQRLALARALAGEPKILILDEATSHLDGVTEERVNAQLASLRCTRVVIAHRLSTIRDADLILVLDRGRIIEQGTHDELLRTGSKYVELVRAQQDTNGHRVVHPA